MGEKKNPKPKRSRPEREAASQGFQRIAGVDEVGRGCLAGPVVAACVVLPWHENWRGLNDSKQLSAQIREYFYEKIVARAIDWAVGQVGPEEIDLLNIHHASLKAMRLAVLGLKESPDFVLIDGPYPLSIEMRQRPLVRGDSLSLSIAAASILAKVTRDRMMMKMEQDFPYFRFSKHKGYATALHREELAKHGHTPIHRKSFHTVGYENPPP